MNALDQKMLRDLWGMWGQLLAIALVIVAGVATYVAMTSVMDTLQRTQEAYYTAFRFAEGFASVTRAPERLLQQLQEVPGLNEVETRVTAGVQLEIEGFDEPVSGTMVSVPGGRQPRLNQLFVREGRFVEPGREDEVLLNEVFAEAHDLQPGDEITAIINGRRRSLTVVGVALSPEHILQVQPGTLFPDPERYGVLWANRSMLAAAYDMEGAFNDVTFTLAPGAPIEDVLDRVDLLLERYGGMGAYGRADQPSHVLLTEEFNQLQAMSTLVPVIFLLVAAFLLNIVVARLINLQREQIAVLKAFGYTNVDVGWHYMKLVLVVVMIGSAAGIALGIWAGRALGEVYLEFYRFPFLEYTLELPILLTAVLLTAGASLLGVITAVRRAVRLPPAEAMRPAPPATYRPTLVERIGLQRFFDQPTRMILRNLERQPIKSILTIVGIATSCAILIMGLFFVDVIDYVVEVQYGVAQREDMTVSFTEPTSTAALYELRSLDGVQYAEPFRSVPVQLRHEHRSYDTGLEGIPPGAYLRRIIDADLQPITIPPDGVVLTEGLAEILQVEPGDRVIVEVREGRQSTRSVPVAALTQQFIGMGAYMDLDAVHRLVGEGTAISGAFLMTDERHESQLMDALQDRPRVASMISQERAIQAYMDTAAETILVFTFVLSLFAGIIAFGVIYNSVRITLSERDRELASLRVLGFTRGEIAYILLGELAALTLVAIPIGFILGAGGAAGVIEGVQTDLFQFPLVLGRGTFALAAVIVLASAGASALIARRKLNRLDLIGVLKTRE